jgi:hypothetical protein
VASESSVKKDPGPDPPLSPSRPTSTVENILDAPGAFDPYRPSISQYDSVLLEKGKVASYLDKALKVLTLHTEARNSFITYASLSSLLQAVSGPKRFFFSY